MRIMITGATGFIGSKLLKKLNLSGFEINALCRRSSDISEITGGGTKIFFGDIMDSASIRDCMKGCEEVYHLAAFAKNWAKDNSIFYKYNTLAVGNILQSAVGCGVRRVLLMSSCVTIGSGKDPADETNLFTGIPLTLYQSSKMEAEKLAVEYSGKGIEVVTVNPTRLFGPGLLTEGNSVSKMINMYLEGKFRFVPGNGKAIGNYVFIDDLVNGCINAMHKGRKGERYLLGGENLSYNEFFRILKSVSGNSRLIFHLPRSIAIAFSSVELLRAEISEHYPLITPGWVKTFTADWAFSSQKAVKEIDYKITPFKEALAKTLEWIYSIKPEREKEHEKIKFA